MLKNTLSKSFCGLLAVLLLGVATLANLPMSAHAAQSTPPAGTPVITLTIAQGASIDFTWDMDSPSPIWVETAPGMFQQVSPDGTCGTYTQIKARGTKINIYGSITWFNCSKHGDNLTAIDVSKNPLLQELFCVSNALTSLDVSKNTALTRLECAYNQLTTLDVSNNAELTQINCLGNQLTALDVSQNTALVHLNCDQNRLTTLRLGNTARLKTLEYSGNPLTAADIQQR